MSDGEPGTADHAQAPRSLFGLIRVATLCVALPAAAIREVVPCPTALDPFPSTLADVIGAIDLRGQLIPVLDLSHELAGPSSAKVAASIVMILRHCGKVFGVLAHAIDGVSLIDDSAIDAFATAGDPTRAPLVGATFHMGDRRGVLLDLAALAARPGMPLCDDRSGQRNDTRSGQEPTLVFTLNGMQCALPTGCVDATLPWQQLAPAPVADSLWIAMLPYKGAEIPAVDTLALLDHGRMEPGRLSGAAVVVRTGGHAQADGSVSPAGLVALLIDSVDDIVRFGADAVTLLPQGTPGTAFARGLVQRDLASCLLLDAERLTLDPRLNLLGAVEQRPDGGVTIDESKIATVTASVPALTRKPYLVFSLGEGEYSVPLDMVEEILPAQQNLVPLPHGGCGLMGLFARRGRAMPIIDLGQCLDVTAHGNGGFVVVVRFGATGSGKDNAALRAGFRVDALQSVERAVVQTLDGERHGGNASRPALGLLERTIRLDNGNSCCVLDLAALAQRIIEATPRAA